MRNSWFHAMAAAMAAAWLAVGIPAGQAHQGEPLDPSITEDSPREYSQLYLERKDMPWVELEEGIRIQDIREGTGVRPFQDATVFVMWRMYDQKDGKEIFYRTKHRSDNFFFGNVDPRMMGGGGMLRAVEMALADMREGGKRLLTVRRDKAFGKEGWSDSHFVVPSNMDVVVELSLMWVRRPYPKRFGLGEPSARPQPQADVPALKEESAAAPAAKPEAPAEGKEAASAAAPTEDKTSSKAAK